MTDKVKLGTGVGDEVGGQDIEIDIPTLIDTRMLIQGNSRSGKSYMARVLCERAAGKVPIIIIDIEGEFASLREKIDAVLVGPDGDIPTDLRTAALLARKILDLRVSAIIDIYELKIHERREYVRLFLDSLMSAHKTLWSPLIVIVDEAHKLCPEKGQGESVATQSVIDLMSLGGKRQFAGVLITQRFSKLHNDAIAEANNVFIGRTWMDTDQVRAGKYLGMSPAERQTLRDIPQGEFYAFGPALSTPGVIRFTGDRAETKPPKPGERSSFVAPKASTAIKHIIEQIGDLPEAVEAEARDIAEVREQAKRREAELQTQIQALQHELKESAKPIVVPEEIHVFPDEQLAELSEKIDEYFKPFAVAVDALSQTQETAGAIERMVLDLKKAIPTVEGLHHVVETPTGIYQAFERALPMQTVPSAERKASTVTPKSHDTVPAPVSDTSVKGGALAMLKIIAMYGTVGGVSSEGILVMTGYKATSRRVYLGELKSKGLAYEEGGLFLPTADGIAILGTDYSPLPTGSGLKDYWLENLTGGELQIFEQLVAAYPKALHKDEIEEKTGYKATSIRVYANKLQVRRAVESAGAGHWKLADSLA